MVASAFVRPRWVLLVLLLLGAGAAAVSAPWWWGRAWPQDFAWLAKGQSAAGDGHGHGDAHGRQHVSGAHKEESSLELTPSGLKSIGFVPWTVALTDFERTISLPGMVVERPGKSQIQITAPMGGIVTAIHTSDGVAVTPESVLFEIRLTHEDLVAAQRDFLKTAENLEVVKREIIRLEALSGLIAGKEILAQKYEQQRLEASLRAERQGLLLHGLSESHIDQIVATRTLLQSLGVAAPRHEHAHDLCREDHLFHVQSLNVQVGAYVETGQLLAMLADHCELYIQGTAFEDDAPRLREAMLAKTDIAAVVFSGSERREMIKGLKLLYLADHVDPDTRAFKFYLPLANDIVVDRTTEGGRRYVQWRYRPGQRLELHVPVDRHEKQIVLPAEAVVEDGLEHYVFRQNGRRFDRVAVNVSDRDRDKVVVANDGALFPGDVVAARGAYQMLLALKAKAGDGADPYAGHSH